MTAPDDDPKATLAAWLELSGALRAFFARRVPAADVDDLLQECYLKVSRALPALEDRERLGAWVFRIARNLVVDHLRRRQPLPGQVERIERIERIGHVEQDEHVEHVEQDVAGGPDGAGEGPDLDLRVGGWLAAMVDQLPPRYAAVLRESELEGRPHREIAAHLGLSVSGVKSRVQRGRRLLRDKLLACCTLEFDRRGGIRDYERNSPRSCDC